MAESMTKGTTGKSTQFKVPEAPKEEFCVFGTVFAKPNLADRLEELYTETTRLAEDEPGTIYYCIARDPDERHIFHFFERYAGREAFDEHNSSDVVKTIMSENIFERVEAQFATAIRPAGRIKK